MKLRLLALCCVLFSLTSCLDIIETFNLNDKGGGTYETKMDMSKMMTMLAMMGAGKEGADKMPEKMDSSFSFSQYTDTSTVLSAEEKRVLSKGVVNMHLSKDDGEMYFTIKMPFENAKEYAIINNAMSKNGGQTLGSAFKGMFGSGMGELKDMFKVNYTTVVNLPRPVKKMSGTDSKVSEDKKQVRFSKKIDLSDGFTAKDFDFSIDF